MPGPLALAAGVNIGSLLLRGLFPKSFGGETQFQGTNPSDFRDQIIIDESDQQGIRQQLTDRLSNANIANILAAKQAGAAGRLPAGAVLSAIRGSQGSIAKGLSGLEANLAGLRQRSVLDFLNLQSRFDQNKFQADRENNQSRAAFFQEGLGGLGQLALLRAGKIL